MEGIMPAVERYTPKKQAVVKKTANPTIKVVVEKAPTTKKPPVKKPAAPKAPVKNISQDELIVTREVFTWNYETLTKHFNEARAIEILANTYAMTKEQVMQTAERFNLRKKEKNTEI